MNDLKCPACGGRMSLTTLTSMPPQYTGECAEKCGFSMSYFNRRDAFRCINQFEMDVFYLGYKHGIAVAAESSPNPEMKVDADKLAETVSKLNAAKESLREYSKMMARSLECMKALRDAVSALNGAKHDGAPDEVIEAHMLAFSAIVSTGKTMEDLRSMLSLGGEMFKQL